MQLSSGAFLDTVSHADRYLAVMKCRLDIPDAAASNPNESSTRESMMPEHALYLLEPKSNGWIMSGKTCKLQNFCTHSGRNPKTGQVGGLP